VINLFALPAGSIAGAARLDITRIPGLHRILVTPDGRRHLLVKRHGRSVQLCLSGGSFSKSVHLLADAIIRPDRLYAGLKVIEEFNHLLSENGKVARYSLGNDDHRLRNMLRALDGRRSGASYRDIAVVLFGASRVGRDWNNSDHLKNHIRRLVKRGEALVGGGYKRFLQHR
jgi:hypothetical protein